MANYIPNLKQKQRDWNGPRRPNPETVARIQATPAFKKMVREKEAKFAEAKAEKRAEVQAFRDAQGQRSKEETARASIEDTAQMIRDHGECGLNGVKSYDEAREVAVGVAERHDKQKGQ